MTVHHLKSKCGGGGGGAMRRKTALLLGLLLTFVLALPVQSQTPTAGPCGLPTSRTTWMSSTTQKTYEMTADCTFSTSAGYYLRVSSGEFTVNGNGYTIYADREARAFQIQSGGTLNLNNVTITGHNEGTRPVIDVRGRLNTDGVTIRDNTANAAVNISGSGARADLTNIRIQDNAGGFGSNDSSAIYVDNGTTVNLENAIITGSSRSGYVIGVYGSSTLNVRGCLTMSGNNGVPIASHSGGLGTPTINNNSIGPCVGGGFTTATPTPGPRKKKKKDPPPTPTATPRPAYAASYVALQTETGMTFEAAYGLDSGVHFRQLDGGGIGVQSIIDAGPLAALDVYGYVEQGVEVCFPQIGRVVFLDARTMPRAITTLPATVRDGMTCVYLDSPGSLALLPN